MVTQTAKADVSFYFYGTGVQLYGAQRQNHGTYQISIDSVVYAPRNASATSPEYFQTSLFSTVALKNGYHTVRMTNLESKSLDLDFVRLSSGLFPFLLWRCIDEAFFVFVDYLANPGWRSQ